MVALDQGHAEETAAGLRLEDADRKSSRTVFSAEAFRVGRVMTWEIAAQIAQVASTVVVGIGVIISMWIGVRGLTETKIARVQSVRPELHFDHGGQRVPCEERAGSGIPGIDPTFAHRYLRNKPIEANRLQAKTQWDKLRNHGTGSALNTTITFISRMLYKSGETIEIDESDLHRFPYHIAFNTVPASPSHISPQETGQFIRLPTPIVWDYDKAIVRIDFVCLICWEDIFKTRLYRAQELRLFVEREEKNTYVVLTFADELYNTEEFVDLTRRLRAEPPLPRI